MITVEHMLKGLVALVVRGVIKDPWYRNFLDNVNKHVRANKPLSTNQGVTVLKAASKHINELARELGVGKDTLKSQIDNPNYASTPYQSISMPREVRYIGMDKLAFRFKVDGTVVHEIKALHSVNDPVQSRPVFNEQYRLWIVTVTPHNLDKVFKIIQNHRFQFDEPVLEFMTLCTNSKKAHSTFAVVDDDTMVANVVNNPLLSYMVKNVMRGEPV